MRASHRRPLVVNCGCAMNDRNDPDPHCEECGGEGAIYVCRRCKDPIGVMIGMLGGNEETRLALGSAVGKEIAGLTVADDRLRIDFKGGDALVLRDDGQSCCESRYMRSDDAPAPFIGATLLGVELRAAANLPAEYDEHEIQFLDVKTSAGVFTCSNHNEHNGYYGGFWIVASYESKAA